MHKMPRILFCTFFGAFLCAILTAILFTIGAMVDGTPLGEAFAFGLVAGILAAFFGALIGLVVAVARLGLLGGGLTGLLATAVAVAFYILAFGRPDQFGYFLRESVIIVVVLALPAIGTGILTALLQKRLLART